MTIQNLKNELGRSMTEMLGVLAIIGVLSVGAIGGYSYAMDKYRANETINDVNLRGIDLVAQVSMGRTTVSLSEWPKKSKAGYDISDPSLSIEGDAYFTISGIPQRVCEMVYEGIMQNQTTDVEINGYVVDDSSTCGDDNTMGFFFITNAGEGGTTPADLCKDITCPEGSSCAFGFCSKDETGIFDTNGMRCSSDNDCPECQSCLSYFNGYNYCQPDTSQSSCDNGKGVCLNARCVQKETCVDNSECAAGYFCAEKDGPSKKQCIKATFKKITLENEIVYLLIGNPYLNHNSAIAACASIGHQLISENQLQSNLELRSAISLDSGGAYFQTQEGGCIVGVNNVDCDTSLDIGDIICVSK